MSLGYTTCIQSQKTGKGAHSPPHDQKAILLLPASRFCHANISYLNSNSEILGTWPKLALTDGLSVEFK